MQEDKKVKDFQPPYQEEQEGYSREQVEDPDRWDREDIKDITDEASHRDANGVLRQTLRGDETKGDPDERDVAGAPESNETAQGREEAKNDKSGAANVNG